MEKHRDQSLPGVASGALARILFTQALEPSGRCIATEPVGGMQGLLADKVALAATAEPLSTSHAADHGVQGCDEFTCLRPQVASRGAEIFGTKRRGHMRHRDQGVAFPLHWRT